MLDICFEEIDGEKVLTWFTESDFQQTVREGDYVNVYFDDPVINITNGRIVDIFPDGSVAINNGKGYVQICAYKDSDIFCRIVNIECV